MIDPLTKDNCPYKCHKECVPNAPPSCGFSEGKLRRVINNTDIQNALANSSPLTRKYHFTPSDSVSPASSTPMSAPGSPAPHPSIPGYYFNHSLPNGNPSICVSESIYCKIQESQSDSDTTSTMQTDTGSNLTDSLMTTQSKLVRQLSQSNSTHADREDFKSRLAISFDDEIEVDPDKRSMNLSTSIQDWVIVFNNIKIIEEVRRSSGSLMKAHWHGELAVRIIKPDPKLSETEFLNQFKNQIFRLRKVRHEHLNLYTGVCIESPNFAIASSWIRGSTLYEMIHIRNDSISLNSAVHYAAQIAQAMSYLHEKSINHMSLRTTNIFVQNNRIVLTDYGLLPLKIQESQSDSDTTSTMQTDTGSNLTDSIMTAQSKLVRQLSQSNSTHADREDFKSRLAISFDDEIEVDPDKRSMNLSTSIQDWVIVFNNIKIIEEVRRSSGSLMKAHWHGELAVRIIKPDPKLSETEFLNQFKNQIFRLRKVRHEHLNLYTGVCIESPNFAIASSWIRGSTLYEMIHIRNDSISLNSAVHYAAQIAQAMSYLHEKSINHMSLRTTNIFVQNNRIVLTDYGLLPLSKCYRYNNQPAIIVPQSPSGPADSYRLNHITKNDIETRLIEAGGRPLVVRTMRIPDSDWAESLDLSGHGYMVFASHRDLRDVIDDCLTIGWMKHDLGVILSRLRAYMTSFEYWRSIAKGDFRYESIHNEPVEQVKHLARLIGLESTNAEHIAREIYSLRPGQAVGPDQVSKMWPAQRVIEASRADGDDDSEKKMDVDGKDTATTVVVVPLQAKLLESERKKIREAHADYHDRYGYV
ncbi:unnamed protein product [Adineta steineri]|uniref:Protein kinase domain-containing protein n=1 Tax=Adineta steineri TaxID=433720 RepID=A0A815FQ47_9BILA|nr:unnamed protein product [Adineta steineri]